MLKFSKNLQIFFKIFRLIAPYLNFNLKLTTMKLIKSFLLVAIVAMVAVSCGDTKKEATEVAGDAVEAVEDAGEATAEAVGDAADATAEAAGDAADAVEEAVDTLAADAEKVVDTAKAMAKAATE